MLKPIPSPTVAAAVPPDLNRRYFEECAQYAFSPRATGCNLVNAWWLMEAAFAAYDVFDSAGHSRVDLSALTGAGYRVRPISNGNTQIVAIENDGALIVAFRGTRVEGFNLPFSHEQGFATNWADVVADASFLPEVIAPGVFVHQGFYKAFQAIEESLRAVVASALAAKRPVWFCGHSLGAALATVAAYHHRDQLQGLYTFGCPRAGNGNFANVLIDALPNVYRFVHHRDVVTTVPPAGFPIASNAAGWVEVFNSLRDKEPVGYAHVGQLRYITGQGTWSIQDGPHVSLWMAALAEDAFAHAREVADVLTHGFSPANPGSWPIAYEGLADHAPIYYANKLFNACVQS